MSDDAQRSLERRIADLEKGLEGIRYLLDDRILEKENELARELRDRKSEEARLKKYNDERPKRVELFKRFSDEFCRTGSKHQCTLHDTVPVFKAWLEAQPDAVQIDLWNNADDRDDFAKVNGATYTKCHSDGGEGVENRHGVLVEGWIGFSIRPQFRSLTEGANAADSPHDKEVLKFRAKGLGGELTQALPLTTVPGI